MPANEPLKERLDCDICGQPYHRHSAGSPAFCPIYATYRPARAPFDTIARLEAEVERGMRIETDLQRLADDLLARAQEAEAALASAQALIGEMVEGLKSISALVSDAFDGTLGAAQALDAISDVARDLANLSSHDDVGG